MTLVDGELPFAYVETILQAFQTLLSAGMMVATAQYFLATFPLVLLVLYVLQKFYLRTSRQIRLLDIEAKAPLYSHFQETLSGLATIRAFGWTRAFIDKHMELLDQSQRPFYLLYCIQRWLQVVLDLMVAALATILMMIVVKTRHEINPGLVGLGMLNVMTFNTNLTWLIKSWTQLEISIGAIARIRDFVRYTECEMKAREDVEPPRTGRRMAVYRSRTSRPRTARLLCLFYTVSAWTSKQVRRLAYAEEVDLANPASWPRCYTSSKRGMAPSRSMETTSPTYHGILFANA